MSQRCTTCMRLLRKSLGRSSHILRFTGMQGRFLASLEMTMLSFSACLRRIFPLSFILRVPYPPLRGTFPSRGRLLVRGSGILVSPPSPWREGFWTSPSFLWKEVPRRGGGWLSQRNEREWGSPVPRFVIPSAALDLSCRSGVRHACGCSENLSGACLTLSVSPVYKEDFSTSLEMTIRGEGLGYGRLSLCFIGFYFFSQYATSVSTAPMPRAVLIPMPVYMAKEARVAARLAAMSFLKKP